MTGDGSQRGSGSSWHIESTSWSIRWRAHTRMHEYVPHLQLYSRVFYMFASLASPLIAFLAAIRLVSGSSSSEQDQFKHVQWDDDNWTIRTHALDQGHYQSRLTLANGYFGINVASAGPFFEVDEPVDGNVISGWPLFSRRQTFSTIAGFWNSQPRKNGSNYPWLYQYGWESFIAGIPHWGGLQVEANGEMLNASVNPDHITDFVSSLDVKAGIASWRYNWKPGGFGDGS